MTTEKSFRRLAFGLLAIFLISAAASAGEWKRGIIVGADGGRIMLSNEYGSTIVAVSSSTLVTLNGRPAKPAHLSVGDAALVMYLIQGGNLPTAQRVEAFRPTP